MSSSDFISQLCAVINTLLDTESLIGIESLLSSVNTENTLRKSPSGALLPPQDTELYYLLRIRTRYYAEGEPPGAILIQRQLLKVFERATYLAVPLPVNEEREGAAPGFLPIRGFKERFKVLPDLTLSAISELAMSQLDSIEASADFLKFKPSPHLDLSLSLKATCLRLACVSFVTSHDDPTSLPPLVKSVLTDPAQTAFDELADAVLDVLAVISISSHEFTADLNRSLRNFITNAHGPKAQERVVAGARRLAECLASESNDKVVSTLYSLVNVLASNPTTNADRSASSLRPRTFLMSLDQHTVASSISLSLKTEDQRQQVYANVIEAIAEMVRTLADEKIAELMISLLGQKFGRVNEGVDRALAWGLAKIGGVVKEKDFRRILKLHARARADPASSNAALTETIMDAHQFMAREMDETSPFREILLTEILNALIEFWANEPDPSPSPHPLLPKYFETLGVVLPEPRFEGLPEYAEGTVTAFRNMWFACVIHGVHPTNKWVANHSKVLRRVAANSPLLTLESTTNDFDADLELVPVLNRMRESSAGMRSLEEELSRLLPGHASEIRGFDHSKLVFVGAVTLVETLRSQNGRCSVVLDYFDDENLEKSDCSAMLKTVVEHCSKTFLDVLRIGSWNPSVTTVGQRELRELMIRCCDPVPSVQNLAQKCCDRLISTFPALLCCEGTTYVLLELLTLLWEGCLTQETDLVPLKILQIA